MNIEGVTYIKVNRVDAEGNDNTSTLEQLTNIRIKYSDIGIVDYPVYTISEYQDYYLYRIVPTDITSSTDYNITSYQFEGVTSSFNSTITSGSGPLLDRIPLSASIDPLGYFDEPNSIYVFQSTPDAPITCSFSGVLSVVSGTTIITLRSGIISSSVSTNSPASINLEISGSFNTDVFVDFRTAGGFTITDSLLIVTQSIAGNNTGNNLVVLEPYVTSQFEFGDCNTLYGNVDKYPFNPYFMDVDYSTNGMIAINSDQIISGSAYRSTVKPYYYSLRRHIYPRYDGSKNRDPGTYEFFYVIEYQPGDPDESWAVYILDDGDVTSYSYADTLKQGDNVEIYQQNGVLKGIGTIIRKSFVPSNPSYYIFDIATPNTTVLYNTPLPINRIDSLYTGSTMFDTAASGVMKLTPNIYRNSNIFPLDEFNSNIFEFKNGASTFPEIPNAGMLVMGDILEVNSKDKVNVLTPGSKFSEAHSRIISDTFVDNLELNDIRQYDGGKEIILGNINVITSHFGVPRSPENTGEPVEYWIPSLNIPATYATTTNYEIDFDGGGAFEVELNEFNQYMTASVGLIDSSSLINNISGSLERGNRWFATVYNEVPNPLDRNSLTPYKGYTLQYTPSNDPSFPLIYRGVYEIISGSGDKLAIKDIISNSGITFGSGNYGLFLWKAVIPKKKKDKYIILDKSDVSTMKAGAIILPNSNSDIEQYFNEITTTFGANTKPPSQKGKQV